MTSERVQNGTRVVIQDDAGRVVFDHVFGPEAWANYRLGFPQPGHQTTIELFKGGKVIGRRFLQHGPGYDANKYGPPPWPAPPMHVEFGPPLRKPQFNGLGSSLKCRRDEVAICQPRALVPGLMGLGGLGFPPDQHKYAAEVEVEAGVLPFMKQVEKGLAENDCEAAFEDMTGMQRTFAAAQTHRGAAGLPRDNALAARVFEVTERVKLKCLRKRGIDYGHD